MGVVLALLVLLPVLVYLLWALAIVCDDWLVPALESICEELALTPEAASATFLAFGSSAPELSINIFGAITGDDSMALSALLGSAIIASSLIPAACTFYIPGGALRLDRRILLRDIGFMVLGFALVPALQTGKSGSTALVALILVAIYPVYVCTVVRHARSAVATGGAADATQSLLERREKELSEHMGYAGGDFNGNDGTENDSSGADAGDAVAHGGSGSNACLRFVSSLRRPLEVLFDHTFPSLDGGSQRDDDGGSATSLAGCRLSRRGAVFAVFAIALAYVSVLSFGILELAQRICNSIGLSDAVAGLTVLAIGAQLPDLIGSLALAKKGMGMACVSNALGSQVIVATLGIGVPALAQAARGNAAALEFDGIVPPLLCFCLLVLLFFVLVSFVGGSTLSPQLTKSCARVLLLSYAVSIVVLIFAEEREAHAHAQDQKSGRNATTVH